MVKNYLSVRAKNARKVRDSGRIGTIQFVDRHIAPELLALLLVEVAVSFALSSAVLLPDGVDAMTVSVVHHAAVIASTVGFTSFLLGLYRPQSFMRVRSLCVNTALGGILALPAVWAVSAVLGMDGSWMIGGDQTWPIKTLLIWITLVFAVRLCFFVAVRLKFFVRRVAVLEPMGEVASTIAAIRSGRAGFFEVVKPRFENSTPAELRAARIRTVLMSVTAYQSLHPEQMAAFLRSGVKIESEPAFWERHLRRMNIEKMASNWSDEFDGRPATRVQAAVNRISDLVISSALLVFTLPLMLLVALLVRLEGPGPILYRQERVGLGGECFVLLKFRSMKCNAEARGPAWAQQRDPRVTRVGLFMRRTRIDELPQLFNILRGQMSFIGPRPERPHFVDQLAQVIPHYRQRARVKPGLTGWAQVNFPYGASVEDARSKLSYDLFYVKNRSLLLDLTILFATVRVILFQEGSR